MSDGPGVVGSRAGVPPRFRQPPLEVLRASVQSAMGCRRPLAHLPSAARQIRPEPRLLSPTSPPCAYLTLGNSPKLVEGV